jgi:hypothetical protein
MALGFVMLDERRRSARHLEIENAMTTIATATPADHNVHLRESRKKRDTSKATIPKSVSMNHAKPLVRQFLGSILSRTQFTAFVATRLLSLSFLLAGINSAD